MENRRQVRLCPTFRVHLQTTAGPEIGPLISSHDKQDPWDPEVQIAPQKLASWWHRAVCSLDYCVLARNLPRRIWIWICRFATCQHGILSHSDTAFPRLQAKGENDGQRIDDLEGPLEAGPNFVLFPAAGSSLIGTGRPTLLQGWCGSSQSWERGGQVGLRRLGERTGLLPEREGTGGGVCRNKVS